MTRILGSLTGAILGALLGTGLGLGMTKLCAADASPVKPADWQRDVRPLLAAKCFACHGPDAAKREADLRLDNPAALRDNRDGAPLIVAGKPQHSLLWRRVTSTDPDERMPPAPDHEPLSATQLKTIRSWIAAGAKTSTHWSHRPIPQASQESPALEARTVKALNVPRAAWVRNEVDLLLQDDLERNPPTLLDPARLARRMSLTLTGLPPTQPLASTSDRSVRRYANQLLASSAYGEHAAVAWLDLARYADTHGYHIDGAREMWRWRDWVIEALNDDMPFDQFTRWQIAGDLLPVPEDPYRAMQQRLATGFFRNTPINSEDGAIDEEFLAEYAAERTIALGAVWLGHTLQCCRCHDHKNDLTLQREFYQLSAFFNDLPEKGVDGRHGNAAPLMPAPSRWQAQRQAQLQLELDKIARQQRRLLEGSRDEEQIRWETLAQNEGPRPGPKDFVARLPLNDGKGRKLSAEKGPPAVLAGPPIWLNSSRDPTQADSTPLAISLAGNTRVDWRLPPAEKFTVTAWVYLTSRDPMTLMAVGQPPLRLQLNKQGVALLDGDEVVAQAPPPGQWKLRSWRQVAWSYDGARHAIWLGDQRALSYDEPKDPTARTGDARSRYEVALPVSVGGAATPDDPGTRGLLDEVSVFSRALSSDEIARLAAADPLVAALQKPSEQRSRAERARIRREYLLATNPTFQSLDRRLQSTNDQLRVLTRQFPSSMVMAVGPKRPTHVLHRGDYRQPRQIVGRDTPAWLPPLSPANPAEPTRLDLANWIVSPKNPLTARVAVNRIWQQHFGIGLTPTPDDFGMGGAAPTHPELLDYLATELIRSGWSQKHVHRLITTSTVYAARRETLPAGPWQSRLLTAEMARDNAMSAAGLLVQRIGGPSVFPYQPAGLWAELARDPNLYSAQVYREDDGLGLYRRSIYTFWKRSAPPPTLSLLGAPNRETCVAMRAAAAGPQRALVTLNDPIFIESSRRLAERVLNIAGKSERLRWGFAQLLHRQPSIAEEKALSALLERLETHFESNVRAAQQLIRVGRSEPAIDTQNSANVAELAAWTMWSNTLINTREFQTIP